MKRLIATAAGVAVLTAAALASPAFADLKPGTKAPDFTAQAYLAGEPFTFKLSDALKKGPVVVLFLPVGAHQGLQPRGPPVLGAIDQFKAQKATVIGVTAGKINELADFSKETEHCGGKFARRRRPGAPRSPTSTTRR